MSSLTNEEISKKYQKKTQRNHLLDRPGMYMGSIYDKIDEVWIQEQGKMLKKNMMYNPGILKLFDEIVLNAADQARNHLGKVTEIKVTIDEKKGFISVYNNGPGIDIAEHDEYKVYIPEMIFCQFLTSTNYDDEKERFTAGTNGIGAKITSTYSKIFMIETVNQGKSYTQVIKDNLDVIEKPVIKNTKEKSFTRITFLPDYKRFKCKTISKATFALLERRTYDIAALTDDCVKVYFNNEELKIKNFSEYIDMFIPEKTRKEKLVVETEKWKVGICTSPFEEFSHMSFVNGVHTMKGGTHVNYILNPVIKKLTEKIKKKIKETTIRPSFLKENMMVFIFSLINQPEFESQAKEELTTKAQKFGSTFEFDDTHFKKIEKMELVSKIMDLLKFKESKALAASDGKKTLKVKGIDKLDDANAAGGRNSSKCTLILTEGDSAKTFAISGLSVIGREYYGVFPLKGKLLNVRQASESQISKNTEITQLKMILGLQNGKKFKNLDDLKKSLRYGKILILTDQDHDGSHIKGLLINFFHYFWPQLVISDDFITCLQTPIVKATKNKTIKVFYNIPEYQKWKSSHGSGWSIKYYKGLGTSTAKEAKECFQDLETKRVFYSCKEEEDENSIRLAFKKEDTDDRKTWIQENTGKESYIDNSKKKIPLKEFFDKEFVLFSIADCERSIPNLMDGLKPSQRKVMYGVFKKNTTKELKVDQLRGFVGEQTSYHHGDKSLNETIVKLSQDFVGSCNNINLLIPCGQLGTRIMGGKDASGARYISTKINPITRKIFLKDDDNLLKYLDDDNFPIEPEYYWPCIPMILVNGCSGIGTGYATDIPPHNPKDIINILKNLIDNPNYGIPELSPWYRGFTGTVYQNENGSWFTEGVWKRKDRTTLQITELPIQTWTHDYKIFLSKLEDSEDINNVENDSTDVTVNFKISAPRLQIEEWISKGNIVKLFKLKSAIKINLTVFDENCKLRVFDSTAELLFHFYKVRKELYKKRYKYLLEQYEKEIKEIQAKVLFIQRIISGEIRVFRVPKKEVEEQLTNQEFPKIDDSYSYLLDMKIYHLTEEQIIKLEKELANMKARLDDLKSKTYKDIWKEDISEVEKLIALEV